MFSIFSNTIMSREVLISLLSKGNNGEQILQILDSIVDDGDDDSALSEGKD